MRGEFRNESAHCKFGPGQWSVSNIEIYIGHNNSLKISVLLKGVNLSTNFFLIFIVGKIYSTVY